jgi:hypothetical protein
MVPKRSIRCDLESNDINLKSEEKIESIQAKLPKY